MADGNLNLKVIWNTIDRLTGPLKKMTGGSNSLSTALKAAKEQLKGLDKTQKDIDSFRKLSRDSAITTNQLKAAQDRVKQLRQAMEQAATPTKAMARQFEAARKAAAELKGQSTKLQESLHAVRGRLNDAGLSTRNLASHQRDLTERITAANQRLKTQEEALARVNARMRASAAARADYEKGMAQRNRLASAGREMLRAGAATGVVGAGPVLAYAHAEDAATQLKVAMMGAGAVVSPEFQAINDLAERLGNRLPGTTAELQDMMTTLQRQGMTAQAVLGGVGEASAYLGVQLKMPYVEAAQFAAKMQDATRATEKEMMGLMDTIQRAYYLGVDAENMKQAFASVSPALSLLKKTGIEATNALAPLFVMADQSSLEGEKAGNALRKVFDRVLDLKKVGDANDIFKAVGTQYFETVATGSKKEISKILPALNKIKKDFKGLDFTDGKGNFGGLDNLFANLERLKPLDDVTRKAILGGIWGDDSETMQMLNLMIDKGKAGYNEVVAKMAAQASLQERVNLQLGTLKNLWDAASGTFTNALVAFGEAVSPEVKAIVEWIGETSAALGAWSKEHPQLSAAIMKSVAAVAALLAVLGAITTALAVMLGPLVVARYGLAMFGIQLGRFGVAGAMFRGALNGIGGAWMWIWRLAMANPIIAIATGIAVVALLIWRNWDWLKSQFTALWNSIPAGARNAATAIVSAFTNLPATMARLAVAVWDGFLNGMNTKAEGVMARCREIALSVASAAKAALGIHSPSRVFAAIGGHVMAGLNYGLAANQDSPLSTVVHLSRKLSQAGAGIAIDTGRTLAVNMDTRPPLRAAGGAAGGGGGDVYITVNVQPGPGMNEETLARMVEDRIQRAMFQAQARKRSRLSDAE